MLKKYFYNNRNYINIIMISIFLLNMILCCTIYFNFKIYIVQQDIAENRTLLIVFENYQKSEEKLKSIKNIEKYICISNIKDDEYIIEKYEVVVDKYENVEKVWAELSNNAQINFKYDELVISNKIISYIYSFLKYFIILIFILLFFVLYNLLTKMIEEEFRNIAILKCLGFNSHLICSIVYLFMFVEIMISFIIALAIYIFLSILFNNYLSNLLSIENILNPNSFSILIVFILSLILSIIIVLLARGKIKKTQPIDLLKEN